MQYEPRGSFTQYRFVEINKMRHNFILFSNQTFRISFHRIDSYELDIETYLNMVNYSLKM